MQFLNELRTQELINETKSRLATKQDTVQYDTLPTASADLEGAVVQYTGSTGNGLTHNYFYECVSDGEATPTYSWVQTNVQPSNGGGGGGGHTIEDSEGTELTQRDTLQFGEGFVAEDDNTNEKTVISPDVMQSGDMSDVITPLPSVQPRYQKYSTEEQVVSTWIDGKPIYQNTVVFNIGSESQSGSHQTLEFSEDQYETIVDIHGIWNETDRQTKQGILINTYDETNGSFYVRAFTAYEGGSSKVTIFYKHAATNNSKVYVTIQYTKTAE